MPALHKGGLKEPPPTIQELVELGATSFRLYAHGFFPDTARQQFPRFADRLWAGLESPAVRLFNAQLFRGSSKTTTLRLFASKRISYGLSRTIMFVSAEASHAERNLSWLKTKVEKRTGWAQAFGLGKGRKWNENEAEFTHGVFGHTVSCLAFGIFGGIRGVNIDDYRPDLIVVDDIITDQAAKSEEQLEKLEDLVLGALVKSLAPEVDSPGAKLVVLQTPFVAHDLTMKALRDPAWTSVRQGCWTQATQDFELNEQESIWPERLPTASLRKDKLAHINRNKLSLWAREMEVKIVTKETADFNPAWLRYYSRDEINPETIQGMHVIIAIDPVPPPSQRDLKIGQRKTDYEAIVVVGYRAGNYYLLDYDYKRGHNPSWTTATLFGLVAKWRPRRIRVESVGYQRTLAWIIRTEMQKNGRYTFVDEAMDRRSKPDRIVDAILGPASEGAFWVHEEHTEFITQYSLHPQCGHDDIIDAVAIAVDGLRGDVYSDDLIEDEYSLDPSDPEGRTLLYIEKAP